MIAPETFRVFLAAVGVAGIFLISCMVCLVSNETGHARTFFTSLTIAAIALPVAVLIGTHIPIE